MEKLFFEICTGCPESRIDSRQIENFLKKNGWNKTECIKKADLILFRACGLTAKEVDNSLSIIRKIKLEKKHDSKFIVWGCLPKIDPEILKSEYSGETFDEHNTGILDDTISPKISLDKITANNLNSVYEIKKSGFFELLNKLLYSIQERFSITPNESIFTIKVSTGCLGNCSFCAVRKSRGVIQSKAIEDIINEFKHGLEKGFRYFSLLGTDLGSYGRDRGYTLVELLNEMLKEKEDFKIGLRNVNPRFLIEMFEKLKPIFLSGKIWFLASAIESGSNRILTLMNRRYNVQDFKRCISWLNKEVPEIFLRTQIIVGFPTESNEDYKRSFNLLDEIRFDWIEVYKFSPRKGTLAADMEGQLPEKIKNSRFRQLTIKILTQHPFAKIKQLWRSYFKSYCESQDWSPIT